MLLKAKLTFFMMVSFSLGKLVMVSKCRNNFCFFLFFPKVQSINAGENFCSRSLGFNFGFVVVVSDMNAYLEHPHQLEVKNGVIMPLVEEGGILSVDYEFPRTIAHHVIGTGEVCTAQSWNPKLVNKDIEIDGNKIVAKSEAPIWRCAVATVPITTNAYFDFDITHNPKPAHRGIEIGIVSREAFKNQGKILPASSNVCQYFRNSTFLVKFFSRICLVLQWILCLWN